MPKATVKKEVGSVDKKTSTAKAKSSSLKTSGDEKKENRIKTSNNSANKNHYTKDDKEFSHKKNYENSYKEKAAEIENNIMQKMNANPTTGNSKFTKLVSVNKLMETGAHIGLPSRRWNPKMKPYIYAKKGTNHIIDLAKTMIMLNDAYNFLVEISKKGGTALIVGTKGEVIKNHVKEEAKRTSSFYINERWLGGTLTNFKTISNSIKKFNNLLVTQIQNSGEIDKYSKKERIQMKKETEKLAKFFGGIRMMKDLPSVIILTDPENEKNALSEARKLGIPVIAICNSNANPEGIDYIIPANNYSIKSIYLLIGILNDAIAEGKGLPKTFVGKKDEEIVFPEIKRRNDYVRVVNHRSNTYTPKQ